MYQSLTLRYVEFSGINPQPWEACRRWQKFHVCGWEKREEEEERRGREKGEKEEEKEEGIQAK